MKYFTSIILLLVLTSSLAQESPQTVKDTLYNSSVLELEPEYPGGFKAFAQYLAANFVVPQSPEYKGGKVIASFVVKVDGSLSNIKILRDPGFGSGDEIKRLLETGERWKPGEIQGNKVNTKYVLPIMLPAPKYEVKSTNDVVNTSNDVVKDANSLETKPNFPGGMNKFYEYIGRNFRTPDVDGLEGKVIMQFVVDKDGSLTDFKVLKDAGYGTAQEAMRVFQNSPKWIPGTQQGVPVRVLYTIPITIHANITTRRYY